jgi:hypothetical protein
VAARERSRHRCARQLLPHLATRDPRHQDRRHAQSPLRGVSSSLEASYDVLSSNSLQGIAAAGDTTVPLQAGTDVRTARVAMQLTGLLHDFIWGTTGYYLHVVSRLQQRHRGSRPTHDLSIDRTQSAFDAGNLQLSLSGPATSAGRPGHRQFEIRTAISRLRFPRRAAGSCAVSSNLVRTVRTLNFNASVPSRTGTAACCPRWVSCPELSMRTLDDVSDFGTLLSTSYGLDWTPLKKLHLTPSTPTTARAHGAAITRPADHYLQRRELRLRQRNETVYVTEITGGNDALAPPPLARPVRRIRGTLRRERPNFSRYEQSRISNAIGALPPTTADVELGVSRSLRARCRRQLDRNRRPLGQLVRERPTM